MEKTPRGYKHALRLSAVTQTEIAEAEARLRAARMYLRGTLGEVWDSVQRTSTLAIGERMAIRLAASQTLKEAVRPILDRELPRHSRLPGAFTPGILLAARALYGIDFQAIRPVDVVGRIAPRPLFFIHGADETLIPPSNSRALAAAARVPHSDVQCWLIPDTAHAQCFSIERREYVRRVIAFFRAALGSETT